MAAKVKGPFGHMLLYHPANRSPHRPAAVQSNHTCRSDQQTRRATDLPNDQPSDPHPIDPRKDGLTDRRRTHAPIDRTTNCTTERSKEERLDPAGADTIGPDETLPERSTDKPIHGPRNRVHECAQYVDRLIVLCALLATRALHFGTSFPQHCIAHTSSPQPYLVCAEKEQIIPTITIPNDQPKTGYSTEGVARSASIYGVTVGAAQLSNHRLVLSFYWNRSCSTDACYHRGSPFV